MKFFIANLDLTKDVIYIIYFPHASSFTLLLLIFTMTASLTKIPLDGKFEILYTLKAYFSFNLLDPNSDPEMNSLARFDVAIYENGPQMLI